MLYCRTNWKDGHANNGWTFYQFPPWRVYSGTNPMLVYFTLYCMRSGPKSGEGSLNEMTTDRSKLKFYVHTVWLLKFLNFVL